MEDGQTNEHLLAVLGAHKGGQGLEGLGLLLGRGRCGPHGRVMGAQVAVAVGLVLHKGDQGYSIAGLLDANKTPRLAAGDRLLKVLPHGQLLHGYHRVEPAERLLIGLTR